MGWYLCGEVRQPPLLELRRVWGPAAFLPEAWLQQQLFSIGRFWLPKALSGDYWFNLLFLLMFPCVLMLNAH